MPEFIIRTEASPERFASIGVASPIGIFKENQIDRLWGKLMLNMLPVFTVDGINEKGVACCVNVVPSGDCGYTLNSNPAGKPLCAPLIVRYVLDKAGSAKEAIELVRERNIYTTLRGKLQTEYHFMISDSTSNYVVEFVDNRMVVLEGEKIMTNFYLSHPDTPHGMGHERYDILRAGYDSVHGIEGYVAGINSGAENEGKSRECVRLVFENLPKVLDEPSDRQARQAMCLAAHYGGNAINTQLAGYVHAFAHTLGALYHISHGEAISLSLLPVLCYQQPSCRDKMAELSVACGFASVSEDSYSASDKFLSELEGLLKKCGLNLSGDIVRREDYPEIIRMVKLDAINYSSPVVLGAMEITHILEDIRKTAL